MTVARLAAALFLVATAATLVDAQAWLVAPAPRDVGAHATDGSIGCPTTTASATTSVFAAGDVIDVRYWTNSSTGGFVRWAIVAQGGAETADSFDAGVFYYTCIQSGPECVIRNSSSGGDDADSNDSGLDGSDDDDDSIEFYDDDESDYNDESGSAEDQDADSYLTCGDTITLPAWLDQGDYVLQCTLFGVLSANEDGGSATVAEPQYVSCADITLTSPISASDTAECITFAGGDRVTQQQNLTDDRCFLYNRMATTTEQAVDDEFNVYNVFGKPSAVSTCGDSAATTDNSAVAGEEDDEDTINPGTVVPATDMSSSGFGESQASAGEDNEDGTSPGTVQPAPASSGSSRDSISNDADAGDASTASRSSVSSTVGDEDDASDDVLPISANGSSLSADSTGGTSGSDVDDQNDNYSSSDDGGSGDSPSASVGDDAGESASEDESEASATSGSLADSSRSSSDIPEVGQDSSDDATGASEASSEQTEEDQEDEKDPEYQEDEADEENNEDDEDEDDDEGDEKGDGDQDSTTTAPGTAAPGGRCRAKPARRA